jgi:hypothetical protein
MIKFYIKLLVQSLQRTGLCAYDFHTLPVNGKLRMIISACMFETS